MTKKEFIEKTFKRYVDDPSTRAVVEGGISCKYRTKDGRACAIGQWIPDEKYKSSIEGKGICNALLPMLPKEVRMLGLDFLAECQSIHDSTYYWEDWPANKKELIKRLSILTGELVNL